MLLEQPEGTVKSRIRVGPAAAARRADRSGGERVTDPTPVPDDRRARLAARCVRARRARRRRTRAGRRLPRARAPPPAPRSTSCARRRPRSRCCPTRRSSAPPELWARISETIASDRVQTTGRATPSRRATSSRLGVRRAPGGSHRVAVAAAIAIVLLAVQVVSLQRPARPRTPDRTAAMAAAFDRAAAGRRRPHRGAWRRRRARRSPASCCCPTAPATCRTTACAPLGAGPDVPALGAHRTDATRRSRSRPACSDRTPPRSAFQRADRCTASRSRSSSARRRRRRSRRTPAAADDAERSVAVPATMRVVCRSASTSTSRSARRRCDYCDFATWTDRAHLIDDVRRRVRQPTSTRRRRRLSAGDERVLRRRHAVAAPGASSSRGSSTRSTGRADAEVTVECNPDSVDADKLATYRARGREPAELRRAVDGRRTCSPRSAARTIPPTSRARSRSPAPPASTRINVDLIYGTPGESLDDWQRSLDGALALGVEHVSAYALTVEPATPLGRQVAAGAPAPDDDRPGRRVRCSPTSVLTAAGSRVVRGVELGDARRGVPAQPPLLERGRVPRHRLRRARAHRRPALVERAHARALHRRGRRRRDAPRPATKRSTPCRAPRRRSRSRCAPAAGSPVAAAAAAGRRRAGRAGVCVRPGRRPGRPHPRAAGCSPPT